MRFPMLLSACAVLAIGTALPASAQEKAHCAAPATPLDRAICGDEETAIEDRAMHMAYASLVERAHSEGRNSQWAEALAQDQKAFLEIREARFNSPAATRAEKAEMLYDTTALRASTLNWLTPVFAARLTGNWVNAHGLVRIEADDTGMLVATVNVTDQVAGLWVCAVESDLQVQSRTKAVLATEAGPVSFVVASGLLTIAPDVCDESGPTPTGSIAGHYFRVGADDEPLAQN